MVRSPRHAIAHSRCQTAKMPCVSRDTALRRMSTPALISISMIRIANSMYWIGVAVTGHVFETPIIPTSTQIMQIHPSLITNASSHPSVRVHLPYALPRSGSNNSTRPPFRPSASPSARSAARASLSFCHCLAARTPVRRSPARHVKYSLCTSPVCAI